MTTTAPVIDTSNTLPRRFSLLALGGSIAVSLSIFILAGFTSEDGLPNFFGVGIVAFIFYMVISFISSRAVEGRRKAADRMVTGWVTAAFVLALVPLTSLIWTVFSNGINRLDVTFFTNSMRNVLGEGGGAYHAIIGTLELTGIATAIALPLGIMTAIYLVE